MFEIVIFCCFKSVGPSAIHGKMFLVTIISKNLLTLKASNGQMVERTNYARENFKPTKEGLQIIWNRH